MIIIRNDALNKIKDWNDSSIHILADFDRTITSGNSDSSWGVLSKCDFVPKEYINDRKKLHDYYRPLEIDETLNFEAKSKYMRDWLENHINLFKKHKISQKMINEASENKKALYFRNGAINFFKNMCDRNIPIIIISAGIGNFIKQFLINNNCYFKNIYIVSNFIKFNNEIATGIEGNIIHSLNKNQAAMSNEIKQVIKNRPNVILLGDSIGDTKILDEKNRAKALKIGFLEEKIEENTPYYIEQFDVVCTNNTGFDELSIKLPILGK